jgi:hypothetical protein
MSVPVRKRMISTYHVVNSTRRRSLECHGRVGTRGGLRRKVVRTGQGYAAGKVISSSDTGHTGVGARAWKLYNYIALCRSSHDDSEADWRPICLLFAEAGGGRAKLWRFMPQPDAAYGKWATIRYTCNTQPTVDTFSTTRKHIRSSTFGCYSLRSGGLAKPTLHR